MFTENTFKKIIQQYGQAWESLDSGRITKIFTKDATYQETPFKKILKGHNDIKEYWENVVKAKQKHVKFTLGNVYIYGNIGIAEWKTRFIRRDNNNREELRGIILAEFYGGKIKRLWEYWHKEEKTKSPTAPKP